MLIAESSSSGTIKAEYIYLNGQPLAKIENNNIYYYHNDHLATPMLITNSSGSTVWQGEYLPFGEAYSITGNITNNIRFPGQYFDDETNLHYNYYRDYNPVVGRYVEADPVGIKKSRNHLFVYALNNPLKYIDETGKAPKKGKDEWTGTGRLCFEKMRTRINSGSCPDWTDCFVCCGDLVPGIYGSASVIICTDVCQEALDKYKKKNQKCCKKSEKGK
jgi:RHS repeat-associated protein